MSLRTVEKGFLVAIKFGRTFMFYTITKMNNGCMYLKNNEDESTVTLRLVDKKFLLPSNKVVEEVYFKHPDWEQYVEMIKTPIKTTESVIRTVESPNYYRSESSYTETYSEV